MQVGTANHSCTPYQPARGVIKRVIHDVIAAVVGLAGFVRPLPHSLKISMAPKTAQNSEDKTDGDITSWLGKDKGDPAGANRGPISTTARPTGRNTTGLGKDAKIDDNITPLLEVRGKSKSQPTIMSFLAGGTQESCTTHTIPPSGDSQFVTETIPLGALGEKTLTEIKELLITASQCGDGLLGALDSCVAVRRKEQGSPTSKEWSQAQQPGNLTRVEATSSINVTLGTEAGQNTSLKPGGRDKEIEKETKTSDWVKDSGDKFYSLMEESDLSSGEHGLSESGSSISSEMGNISSSNEPTVRQLRRQHKCTKIRFGSQEGTEFSTSSGSKTLKWDYSGIRLIDTTDVPTTSGQQLANNNMEGSIGGSISGACMVGTDSGMLQSIYNSMKELQTETRIENRCARGATKWLQGTVCKVMYQD
ncbi:hypothetical protein NDU88_007212 [Pleurodeles waltl]|uniref:Uncharacterized protein n=1 Tax=Pleurodeles waltl TaxID=8319 RepID=A0AAV7UN73_PLEWA|nr:hypothetical protein NDU88_007212 [Pleurodeles waltl]